jgi:hypothetical protein
MHLPMLSISRVCIVLASLRDGGGNLRGREPSLQIRLLRLRQKNAPAERGGAEVSRQKWQRRPGGGDKENEAGTVEEDMDRREGGNWLPSTAFCGPGSLRLRGFMALIAPCGGASGLPKEAAPAAVAAVTIPPAAVAVSMLRREIIARSTCERPLPSRCPGRRQSWWHRALCWNWFRHNLRYLQIMGGRVMTIG